MHLYIIPRGVKHQIDLFETYIQAQMFPWRRKNLKTGDDKITMLAMGYRDCGPFKELVFPKECLADVLLILGKDPDKIQKSDYAVSWLKYTALRTILGNGVKKLPKKVKYPDDLPRVGLYHFVDGKVRTQPYRYVEKRGVACHIIGMKEDEVREFKHPTEAKDGYLQEMI